MPEITIESILENLKAQNGIVAEDLQEKNSTLQYSLRRPNIPYIGSPKPVTAREQAGIQTIKPVRYEVNPLAVYDRMRDEMFWNAVP